MEGRERMAGGCKHSAPRPQPYCLKPLLQPGARGELLLAPEVSSSWRQSPRRQMRCERRRGAG